MLRWFTGEADGKALAIVSPGRGEGRSYLAANLAVGLLAAWRTHAADRLPICVMVVSTSCLALTTNSACPPCSPGAAVAYRSSVWPVWSIFPSLPQAPFRPTLRNCSVRELFPHLLDKVAKLYDVIIIDTPAGTEYADAQTISARAGGALLLARQNYTSMQSIGNFSATLGQLGTTLVGAVLNGF